MTWTLHRHGRVHHASDILTVDVLCFSGHPRETGVPARINVTLRRLNYLQQVGAIHNFTSKWWQICHIHQLLQYINVQFTMCVAKIQSIPLNFISRIIMAKGVRRAKWIHKWNNLWPTTKACNKYIHKLPSLKVNRYNQKYHTLKVANTTGQSLRYSGSLSVKLVAIGFRNIRVANFGLAAFWPA